MKKLLLLSSILMIASTSVFAADTELYLPDLSPFNSLLQEKVEKIKPIEIDFPEQGEVKTVIPKVDESAGMQDKAFWVNLLPDDEQKIKEWAKLTSKENYIIINKKKCSAVVYDKEGNEIIIFEVGIGKEIGDDFNDTSGLVSKATNTTPAGEFILNKNIFNKAAYGDITLSLGAKANKSETAKKMVALHKVPKFRQERLCKFNDGNLTNNRMSHGCINFLEKDFKNLIKYIKSGSKVYILPEEEGNSLRLIKNKENEFRFVQTKH